MTQPILMWFRRDLRLTDNLALSNALEYGAPIVPIFIFDPIIGASDRIGAPRMQFLLQALYALNQSLQSFGTHLLIRHGEPLSVLRQLATETHAQAVFFNRDYSPYSRARDEKIDYFVGIDTHSFDDEVLMPPKSILKDDGKPYVVFTPFKKTWNKHPKPPTVSYNLTKDDFLDLSPLENAGIPSLQALGYTDIIPVPIATEAYAQARLQSFLKDDIYVYNNTRNMLPINPFEDQRPQGTSYLSPYLRLGLISIRACYWSAREAYLNTPSQIYKESVETWVSELTWREFYTHILYFFPHVLKRDFVDTYLTLQWRDDPQDLQAWKNGMTGYPIIDAPMRQLAKIGWMPNRARMIVASFLTKHLLIHWSYGDKHFMQHLIDGDPAANNGGWQWSAGTGTDAQPYFRIFNPINQSKNFATAEYLRHWIPELNHVDETFIHTPWLAPTPPQHYPMPIVNHDFARHRTLNAFKSARGETK